MKKLILAFAAVAFIGFGGAAVSAQTPPTTLPGAGETPDVCKEWDGVSPIPAPCVDFYIEEATTTTAATTTTTISEEVEPPPTPTTTISEEVAPPTTVAPTTTVPAGSLPRTGSGVSPILGIGALLFVGGGIVVVATRRRTNSAPSA
jgi:LPXTG-motif cell wall-anchored protein